MSPRRVAGPASGGGGGRVAVSVLLVLVVAVALFLIVRARPEPGAFDPRSNRDDGARALVLLLEGEGATVEVASAPPAPGDGARVLVLDDSLDDGQRERLLEFVERGGVAIVADPASTLHGAPGEDGGSRRVTGSVTEISGTTARNEANVPNDRCSIAALEELRGVFVRDGLLFPVGPDEPQCLGDGDGHAFVVRREIGNGTVVGLGDNRLLTNELIRYADNSGLAVALLAPRPGASVDVLVGRAVSRTPEDVGSGDETLGDLIRPGVWMGLTQLALAFVVLALARGIRPGRPVDEPLPSPLEGSEAVRARANMMNRAGHHSRAGWLLRSDLHRELCVRYHLPASAALEAVDAAAVDRDGLAPGEVAQILTTDATDARSLLDLSTRITRLRAERLAPDAATAPVSTGGPLS